MLSRDYDLAGPLARLWLLLGMIAFAVILGCPRAEAQPADRLFTRTAAELSALTPGERMQRRAYVCSDCLDAESCTVGGGTTENACKWNAVLAQWEVIGTGGAVEAGTTTVFWSGGTVGLLSNTVTNYFPLTWAETPSATSVEVLTLTPLETITTGRFYCKTDGTTPGAGNSYDLAVYVPGAGATTCACTIADAATDCEDADGCGTVGASEWLTVESTPTSTPSAANIWCTLEVTYEGGAGGGGSGDSLRVEDSDNAGTFTAAEDADFDDSGDINFAVATGPPDVVTATVRPDSVALTTDTTGNYAAGAAEAGAALTGDSATAFFSAGTIEDARIDGSTEADELVLVGDVDGAASTNDLDEANVETELEAVLDLDALQGQITDAQIADAAVDGGNAGEIADGSITADDLGADSVSSSELNATGVETELEAELDIPQLQGQVGDGQIADSAIDGGTGGEIEDATVTAADLGTDSVAADELSSAVETELEALLELADLQGDLALGTKTSGTYLNNVVIQVKTAGTSTYTPTAGMVAVLVIAVAGGGGAPAETAADAAVSGGGGGGAGWELYTAATIGAGVDYTVAATSTTTGNTTSLGTAGALMSCTGGAVGVSTGLTTTVGVGAKGGLGGICTGADLNIRGGSGGRGMVFSTSNAMGGNGGDSIFGGGGRGGSATGVEQGEAGGAYGAGAGGGETSGGTDLTAVAGAAGILYFIEYIGGS